MQSRRELKGEHPKIANSGEHRIAWALGMAGLKVSEADVSMIWPMLPPVAFELLCAFFLYAGLESRNNFASKVEVDGETTASEPELAPIRQVLAASDSVPAPSDPRPKRRTKRQQKREKGVAWVRRYREKHGKAPALEVVSNVLKVPQTTAHRWRKMAA